MQDYIIVTRVGPDIRPFSISDRILKLSGFRKPDIETIRIPDIEIIRLSGVGQISSRIPDIWLYKSAGYPISGQKKYPVQPNCYYVFLTFNQSFKCNPYNINFYTLKNAIFSNFIKYDQNIQGESEKTVFCFFRVKIWKKQGCSGICVCHVQNKESIYVSGRYYLPIRYINVPEPLE